MFKNTDKFIQRKYLLKLFLNTFVLAVIANLTIITYFPLLVVIIGLILTFSLLYRYTLKINDIFGFIIITFLVSFFQYGGSQGGLFNLSAFVLPLFHKMQNRKLSENNRTNKFILIFGVTLIIFNFAGYLFKFNSGIGNLIQGAATFLGFVFVFQITSKLILEPYRYGIFIKSAILISAYSLIISINKFFSFLYIPIPLFGGEGRWGSQNIGGILGASPISGEWGMILVILLTPIFFSKKAQQLFNISNKYISFGLIVGVLTIIIGASRSTIILASIFFILMLLIFNVRYGKLFDNKFNIFFLLPFIVLVVTFAAPYLNLEYLTIRFTDQLDVDAISLSSLQTGEGINRSVAFSIGEEMLERENWFLGYGWGILRDNRIAWFGDENFYRQDPHSLYLSIPMLFGWVGSVSFLLLFATIILKLYRIISISYKNNSYLFFISIGFMFFLIAFLINEYKITFISYSHYTMIIVILLGISNSVINTYKLNK